MQNYVISIIKHKRVYNSHLLNILIRSNKKENTFTSHFTHIIFLKEHKTNKNLKNISYNIISHYIINFKTK